MRVVKEKDGGIVCRVVLIDDFGFPVETMTRFLGHLIDAGYSPHRSARTATTCTTCLSSWPARGWTVGSSGRLPPLAFLGFLRRQPRRRPAQRLGLAVATGEGRLLAPASVQRVLAAASSRYEWAIAAGSTPGRMNSDTVGRSAARY